MKPHSILTRFKQLLASFGWKLFIWGNHTTQEAYWEEIYEQEKAWKQSNHRPL